MPSAQMRCRPIRSKSKQVMTRSLGTDGGEGCTGGEMREPDPSFERIWACNKHGSSSARDEVGAGEHGNGRAKYARWRRARKDNG